MTIDAKSLDQGEQLLWHDKPDVGAFLERRNSAVSPSVALALLAVGAALAAYGWLYEVSGENAVILLLPVLLGVALSYLPFRIWREARRTNYALTNRRAIIESPGMLLRNRVSVPFSEIRSIEVRNGAFGDILFRDFVGQSEHGFQVTRDGFFAIADVERVERLFRTAVEKAPGGFSAGNRE